MQLGMSLAEYKNTLGSNFELIGEFYQKAFGRSEELTDDECRRNLSPISSKTVM